MLKRKRKRYELVVDFWGYSNKEDLKNLEAILLIEIRKYGIFNPTGVARVYDINNQNQEIVADIKSNEKGI